MNFITQFITYIFGKLLGIVEQFVFKFWRKNNCSCKYRSGKATTPGLVTPRLQIFMLIPRQ